MSVEITPPEKPVGGLIPKWAEEKMERAVATGEEAVDVLRIIANHIAQYVADHKRYVDHITKE